MIQFQSSELDSTTQAEILRLAHASRLPEQVIAGMAMRNGLPLLRRTVAKFVGSQACQYATPEEKALLKALLKEAS